MYFDIDEIIQRYPRCKNFKRLYLEALEKGGFLTWDDKYLDIILKGAIITDMFDKAGIPCSDIVGLYIRPMDDHICTYLAVVEDGDVVPKVLLADKIEPDCELNAITAKSFLIMNSCSLCHKDILIKDQKVIHYQHYCPDCYAMLMKEQKQEQQVAGLYGEI